MYYAVRLTDEVRDEALVRRIIALVEHQFQMLGGIKCIDKNATTFDAGEVLYKTKYVGQAVELIKRACEELEVDMHANPFEHRGWGVWGAVEW